MGETDSKQINTVQSDTSENKSMYKEVKRIKKRVSFRGQSVRNIFKRLQREGVNRAKALQ